METWHILIILGILAFVAEVFTAGFISGAIGIGFLAAALGNYWNFDTEWQIACFALGVSLTYFLIRPVILKLQKNTNTPLTNQDALIGKIGRVTEEINHHLDSGRVKVDGDNWKAQSITEEIIPSGTKVRILNFESIILKVEPIKE